MHGLYLLWWVEEKEMSPAVVASILAAGDIALMCLELPTGWFADRVGHRVSLITGSFVQVLAMVWCWLGEGVVSLIGASMLVALGDACRSGADEALLYRTCVALGREDDFQTIEARADACARVALVVLVLAGGVIVGRWGFATGWAAETGLCAMGLFIACAMAEPPVVPEDNETHVAADRALFSAAVATLILPTGLLVALASAAAFLAQTGGDTDATRMTMLVALITLAEAAGSAVASRLPARGARTQLALAAAGALVFAIALGQGHAIQPAALMLAFLMGVAGPLRAAAIQRLASDGVRARAASLASACDMAFMTLVLPLSGLWQHRRSRY